MPDLEKKLELFSRTILNEAEAQKEKSIQELERKKISIIKEKELEFLNSAYEDIQSTISKISKENNEYVLKVEMELKKDIIKKREDIIENIFKDVMTKLESFIASPDYLNWLIAEAKKAVAEIGNGTLNITLQDKKYIDILKSEFPDCKINVYPDNEIIGGVIAEVGNLLSNHSIKESFETQRQNFLRTSGLSIKA